MLHRDGAFFRGDIEGLRAIAILLVIACHAGIPKLAGGFVGVDAFFVISGYLITRLLLTEWSATGRIDFAAFYARRARRLVPALLVVLVVTALATGLLLAPWEQLEQSVSVGAAALWISNLRFALVDLDYFAPSSATNVVLHTWSLGVEEQFYLVWPAWLLALLGAWRWQRREASSSQLVRGLVVTLPLAIAVAVVLTSASPRLGFYMMPARFWQFTVGAIVYAAIEPGRRKTSTSAAGAIGLVGVATLALAAVVIDSNTRYPGPWSLLPTMGAAAVIAAGTLAPSNVVARVLSRGLFQTIGRLSYGWYLWHWPILVLGSTAVVSAPLSLRIGLMGLALLLAALSFHFVEDPIRRSTVRSPRNALLGTALCLTVFVGCVRLWQDKLPDWSRSDAQGWVDAARRDLPDIYRAGCDDWFSSDRVVPCIYGREAAHHTAVVLGDSVALQWFPAYRQVFADAGWRLVVLTKSSCPAADIEFVYERIGRRYDECTRWRRAALDYIVHDVRPDIVITGSSAAYSFDRQMWFDGTRTVLSRLVKATPNVYLMRPTPLLGFDGLACLSRQVWRPTWLIGETACSLPAKHADAFQGVADAAHQFPTVRTLDLDSAVCPGERCAAARQGRVVYRDGQHLTASFAATLAPVLAKALEPGMRAVEAQPAAASRQ